MKTEREICQEIGKGHDVMINILSARLIKMKAASTLLRKHGIVDFISYIEKSNDDSFFVDMLPFVKERVEEDEKTKKRQITLGMCGELIPIIQRLLARKYESYMVVALDFVRSMIKRWFVELREMSRNQKNQDQSLSLPVVYFGILGLSDRIKELSKRETLVGEKARVVQELFAQL